jgi:hypothetical protein
MRFQRNEIRVVLFDVGGVLVELSGLTMLLSWLVRRVTAEQVRTLWLTSPKLDHSRLERCNRQLLLSR